MRPSNSWSHLQSISQSSFCVVGYVPRSKSTTSCREDKTWKPDPVGLVCIEAVALILGGKVDWDNKVGELRAEVYDGGTGAEDGSVSQCLDTFVRVSWGQSLFYFQGKLVLCGGCTKLTGGHWFLKLLTMVLICPLTCLFMKIVIFICFFSDINLIDRKL